MNHAYAKDKLELLLRDLSYYTADEFRRQMMRIAGGATDQDIPDDAHTIKAECDLLADALEVLFESYKELADSGDAGNWKLEDSEEGQKAIAALAAYRGEK